MKQPLIETYPKAGLRVVESDPRKLPKGVLCRLEGVFGETETDTENGRTYSNELWRRVLESDDFRTRKETKSILGEADHPEGLETSVNRVSHVITDLALDEANNAVMGSLDVLDTPGGRIINTLVEYGWEPGISSRGAGEIVSSAGHSEIDAETYEYITHDIVVDPACRKAHLSRVGESRSRRVPLTEALKRLAKEDRKEYQREDWDYFRRLFEEKFGIELGAESAGDIDDEEGGQDYLTTQHDAHTLVDNSGFGGSYGWTDHGGDSDDDRAVAAKFADYVWDNAESVGGQKVVRNLSKMATTFIRDELGGDPKDWGMDESNQSKIEKPVTGPGGHVPDGTGPYGRGAGPGGGRGDGSGLKAQADEDDEEARADEAFLRIRVRELRDSVADLSRRLREAESGHNSGEAVKALIDAYRRTRTALEGAEKEIETMKTRVREAGVKRDDAIVGAGRAKAASLSKLVRSKVRELAVARRAAIAAERARTGLEDDLREERAVAARLRERASVLRHQLAMVRESVSRKTPSDVRSRIASPETVARKVGGSAEPSDGGRVPQKESVSAKPPAKKHRVGKPGRVNASVGISAPVKSEAHERAKGYDELKERVANIVRKAGAI